MSRRSAAIAALALLASCRGGDEPEPDLREDPWIAPLLARCEKSGFYDRNLADVRPILVEKLERGEREPLRRAVEELAGMGERAVDELRRFLERHFTQPFATGYLLNALDVVALSEVEAAREIALTALEHPAETVRVRAARALSTRHAEPEDFERLLDHVRGEQSPEARQAFARALVAADPGRAARTLLEWAERPEERADVLSVAGPWIAERDEPAVHAEAARAWRDVPPGLRPWIAAAAARGGDEEARAWLVEGLAGDSEERRGSALAALRAAAIVDPLVEIVLGDPLPQLRALAASALGEAEELSAEAVEALRAAFDDPAPDVRRAALGALVARGDRVAVDRAVGELTGPPRRLEEAMGALRPRMLEDEELARRVIERLLERDELERFLPLERRTATLSAIGRVPHPEAARFLRDVALEAEGVEIAGMRAHRWLMVQASNTGEEGRDLLMAEFAGEEDPRRRLDLLWAASAARADAVRERLLAFLEEGEPAPPRSPLEVLFAADRLVRVGPASVVAPRLKRLAMRVEEPADVRRALNCLLWRWY